MKPLSNIMKQSPVASSKTSNSEIRKHYFLESYVIIAPKRNLRPDAFSHAGEPHKIANPSCHFCRNDEAPIWQAPRGHDWQVKVINNAFPALTTSNPKAFGSQEIVINTPNHDLEFSELPLEHIEEVFEAYRRRLTQLKRNPGIRYVLVFKNDGPMAGASVAHAHCQIFALPLVPPAIEQESDALNHYRNNKASCAYCDVLAWEEQQSVRIIASDKHALAVSPYAGAYPYEAWLLPRRHVSEFAELNHREIHSFATILRNITARLDSMNISFNYFLQESLPGQEHHFVLKVAPRTTKWAGAELGTGVIINPVAPEYSALWYRGKL